MSTEDKCFNIGNFKTCDSKDILYEDTIGSFKSKGKTLFVKVFSNEGPIPHFHLMDKDKKFETCIQILKPEYFLHGTKMDILNSQQIKDLVKFLNKKDYANKRLTNFVAICRAWNLSSSNEIKVPLKKNSIPDYSELNKRKI